MTHVPRQLTLDEWDGHYTTLKGEGLFEPTYGGPISRHLEDGDLRLESLLFDNSSAALRLWNFLLTEEERLADAKAAGTKLVGTMKDLGTVPVLAYSFENVVAFYPDGAWWIPCIMEQSAGLLGVADTLGVDESFCPVRALLGAFVTEAHFPLPDLLVCSTGAVCDDFSAIAQRLQGLGHPIEWWEIPHRRSIAPGETSVSLPGGVEAPAPLVKFVEGELSRVKGLLEHLAGRILDEGALIRGIQKTNAIRECLRRLRFTAFTAPRCPMPALEMLIAEMLTIHFCSDQGETLAVLSDLVAEVESRVSAGTGYFDEETVRVFWVNPVADLKVMNLLEANGGRISGTEYLFTHALDPVPTDIPPMEALARTALADPMVGPAAERARRIVRDIASFGCEAVVISRIPGASHCATEGEVIAEAVRRTSEIPVLEIEVPPLSDPYRPSLETRIQALFETVRERRKAKIVSTGKEKR